MCIFFQGERMVLFLESKKPLHLDVKWRDSYVWWGWLQPKCFDDKLDVINPCKYVTCNHYFGGKSCTSTFLVLLVTHSNLEWSEFNHAHFWQTCKMNHLFSSKASPGFHAEAGAYSKTSKYNLLALFQGTSPSSVLYSFPRYLPSVDNHGFW